MKTKLTLVLEMDSPYRAADLIAVVGRAPFGAGTGAHLTDEDVGKLVRQARLVGAQIEESYSVD